MAITEANTRLVAASPAELRTLKAEPGAQAWLQGINSSDAKDKTLGGGEVYALKDQTLKDDGYTTFKMAGQTDLFWVRDLSGEIDARWFGVRTDGVDCRKELLTAWRWIMARGGTLRHPTGNINIGKEYEKVGDQGTRLPLQAQPDSKPFTLKGNNSWLIPEDIPLQNWQTFLPLSENPQHAYLHQVRHIAFFGSGSGLNSKGVFEPTATNCAFPPFTWDGIHFNYSAQTHQGGVHFSSVQVEAGKVTSAVVATNAKPGETVAESFDDGARLFDIDFAEQPVIINSIFKNNYGNGLRCAKCYLPRLRDLTLLNISANQIKNPVSGGEASDHTGGGIFFNSCYGGSLERLTVNNQRRYLKSSQQGRVETQGTICGYIGIWVEYGIDENTTLKDNNNNYITNDYKHYVPGITEDLLNTTDPLAGMQQGTLLSSLEVRGYTLGIKSENSTDYTAIACKVTDCYIPYALNGGRGRLFGCHGAQGITVGVDNPQAGLRTAAGVCNFIDFNTVAFSEAITMQTPRRVGCVVEACVFVGTTIPCIFQQGSGAVWRSNTCIQTGGARIIGTGQVAVQSFGALFEGNYFKMTSTSASSNNNFLQNSTATFANNRFDSEQIDQQPNVIMLGTNPGSLSGKGEYLFLGNKFRGNWVLRIDGDAYVKSVGNTFLAWEPNTHGGWHLGSSHYAYPIVVNSGRPGITSIGDVIELRTDHPTAAILDAGNYSSYRDLTIRLITPNSPAGSNLTRLVNLEAGCKGASFENVTVTGNDHLQAAFIATGDRTYDLSFTNVRDDSAVAAGFFAGTAVSGPIYMERCHWGDSSVLYRDHASETREPNTAANLNKDYKPRRGERLAYINASDITRAAGIVWNGTAWVSYALAATA